MKLWRRRELRDSIRPERVKAVMEFGFTEPQARFVLHVLVYSGVFIERQYRAFTGVSHGQRTKDFLSNIVGRGYATAMTPGKLHQGRLFHVQYKPLYEAIGEANNRNRKPASNGRFVERLMLLDAVIGDAKHSWLGTERDKLRTLTTPSRAIGDCFTLNSASERAGTGRFATFRTSSPSALPATTGAISSFTW